MGAEGQGGRGSGGRREWQKAIWVIWQRMGNGRGRRRVAGVRAPDGGPDRERGSKGQIGVARNRWGGALGPGVKCGGTGVRY